MSEEQDARDATQEATGAAQEARADIGCTELRAEPEKAQAEAQAVQGAAESPGKAPEDAARAEGADLEAQAVEHVAEGEKEENSERATGIRDGAVNEEGMLAAEEEEEGEVEDVGPSFFVEEDQRHRIEVDILYNPKDGRLLSVSRAGLGISFDQWKKLTHLREWFEFSVPTYDHMATYRQRSSVYRRDANKLVADHTQVRNYLLVYHLKDWSLRDKSGRKVELHCDEDGSLTKETITKVYRACPILIDMVLTVMERELLLE